MTPDELLARVLYRDGLMIIIDKPAGLPVHAGPGRGPNLEQYFDALRYGLPRPPGLAHRLDRDTSGCLVLGRHPKALRKLGNLFSEGRVEKIYWAVVIGHPPAAEGRIDLPLRKIANQKGWKMETAPDGQTAVTDYRVMGSSNGLSWLELYPRTGRTHQIRVHCASLGCPLLGDFQYGGSVSGKSLHLHARAISVPLYPNREPVVAAAIPPQHMHEALMACGWVPEGPA